MGQWEAVNETDAIYVKIDDDVVRPGAGHRGRAALAGRLRLTGL